MKTLVIVAHPNLEQSVVNKRLLEEIKQYPNTYKIHDLHAIYPDGRIDVKREQQLIESHDQIVFQVPIYWFSFPSLLKKWMDEVLTYNWAYGRKNGYKLSGKKVAVAVTAGRDEKSSTGTYSLEQLTKPFEMTFDYIKASYKGMFAVYGVYSNAVVSSDGSFAIERTVDATTLAYVDARVGDYLAFLEQAME